MVIDWVSIVLAAIGGVVTLYLKQRNPAPNAAPGNPAVPAPTPGVPTPVVPAPVPGPGGSGTPILDAILAILKQLSAEKAVAGIEARLTHADASNVRINISKEAPSGNV